MIRSIQQFQTKGVKNLEKVFVAYSSDMTKIAEMIEGVKDSVINLVLSMITEELETYDEYFVSTNRLVQNGILNAKMKQLF